MRVPTMRVAKSDLLKGTQRKSLIKHPGARSAPGKIRVYVYFLKEMLREFLINHPGAGSAPGKDLGFRVNLRL